MTSKTKRNLILATTVFASLCTGLVLFLLVQPWLIVSVKGECTNGHRIVVPVPMTLAKVALLAAPEKTIEKANIAVPHDFPLDRKAALEIARSLRESPDGVFVKVDTPQECVRIEKSGNTLQVQVKSQEGNMQFALPLEFMESCIDSVDNDGRIRNIRLASALSDLRFSHLAQVKTKDVDVEVWSW